MSDPFLGEIKMLSFSWAPKGWAFCDGTIMQINQNQALFVLLGNSFGGDAKTTFALPDMRGRTPVCITTTATSPAYSRGNSGGLEAVTLTANEVPPHTHTVNAYIPNGSIALPTGNAIASLVTASTTPTTTNFSSYLPASTWTSDAQLNAASVTISGGNQPHNNMQPFTVLNFCICTSGGSFPMRN